MQLEELRQILRQAPLVASVQASPHSPVEDSKTLLHLAEASLKEGVQILRLQGAENIRTIKSSTSAPVIGLIKKESEESEVYITPTAVEVDLLIKLGCEIIALDGTRRPRPGSQLLPDLIERIHKAGKLAMADCDTPESVRYALKSGADIVGTTLAGYTQESWATKGPDFEFLREAVRISQTIPVLAEGRYQEPWQAQTALRIGASGVVIGGAINDPIKQTRRFATVTQQLEEPIGAVDIGGTWLRFGVFDPSWKLLETDRIELPQTQAERETWIRAKANHFGVQRLGISSGGTIDPQSKLVIEAKPIIPDYVGSSYDWEDLDVRILNDGLATAWGHGCHSQFAGMRVATLALGTGVGCGLVVEGSIWSGPYGEYPRLNDLAIGGLSFEELLGGAALSSNPTLAQIENATSAAKEAIKALSALWMPDVIVVCGGVGLSAWMQDLIYGLNSGIPDGWVKPEVVPSPFGSDAGLYGAAALALYWEGPN